MYFYLGSETVVSSKDVIGIFDLDNTSTSRITKAYLNGSQKKGTIIAVSNDLPKSFVVCKNKNKETVYLSQISPATLKKRAGF